MPVSSKCLCVRELAMEDLSPQSSQQEERKLIEHLSGEDGGKATQTDATDCGIQEDEEVELLIRRRCGMPANAWGSCILSTLIYRRWISGEFFVVGGLQMFGLVCTIATQLVLLEFLAFLADERHRGDDQVKECTTMTQPTGQIGQIFGSPTWVCAIVLGAYIYANEIRETLSMFNFINQIPAPERSQSRFWYSKDESDKDKSDKDKEALNWSGSKRKTMWHNQPEALLGGTELRYTHFSSERAAFPYGLRLVPLTSSFSQRNCMRFCWIALPHSSLWKWMTFASNLWTQHICSSFLATILSSQSQIQRQEWNGGRKELSGALQKCNAVVHG